MVSWRGGAQKEAIRMNVVRAMEGSWKSGEGGVAEGLGLLRSFLQEWSGCWGSGSLQNTVYTPPQGNLYESH